MRASGRKLSWLLPASVSFRRNGIDALSRSAASGTAGKCPPNPRSCPPRPRAFARHSQIVDCAQRAGFRVEHQQPRLAPFHLAALLLGSSCAKSRFMNSPSIRTFAGYTGVL